MKSPTKMKLVDIFQFMDDSVKNVCLLTSNGTGGWGEKLAWDPQDKFIYESGTFQSSMLVEFIKKNSCKNRLVVGFISYEFAYQLHDVRSRKKDLLGLPKIYFLAYENFITAPDRNKLIEIPSQLSSKLNSEITHSSDSKHQPFRQKVPHLKYKAMFDQVQDYIKSGHVYQINLSHNLEASTDEGARSLFYRIAINNQASMMSYIEGPGFELLSLSPERFISVKNGRILTTPIKGTRPLRNSNQHSAAADLLADPKEKSELYMITDLLRNDLSKISEIGSVKVTSERETQALSNVIHSFSRVESKIKRDISPIEAILSMFPGGSITGCPKKRAIQIIDELESTARSDYCGSLVCIEPNGDLDSNILIRTVLKKGKRLVLPIGGGIVFDSKESAEFQETLDKAESIIAHY
jgi:para-aminobenzoate synthetase component 1